MSPIEEQNLMELIVASGEARSKAHEALQEAKNGNYDVSDQLVEEAEAKILGAHKVQTNLLTMEAQGNLTEMTILSVHAQDHLMTCILAVDLIKELIEVHKIKGDK